ncbi:23S rRNA (pseudouridine(1915)-N(3))-methyltransferase RlmH [Mycoplasmopsis iners]|uniref:23S rRNA (pseudouridine(1915)-N(3))-methyltransferase RlmH n=1 Tax=Mycoplasmopsis iners TaxID=76630 RepID=UPI000494DC79|nr:23S rRNA (pseudouridine(1915)-N(3))-methyltransferase RlmH [Mycoplasmopsis iners]
MKKIKLIAVGSLSPDIKKIFNDYIKNIQHFCSFTQVEIKEFSEIKNLEEKKLRETKLILENIDQGTKIVLLSLKGKQYKSEQFAYEIVKNDNLTFIIGGSDGVIENLVNANYKISFSEMTFPHQLFRVMLAEQIYRAFMIQNNKKYHK